MNSLRGSWRALLLVSLSGCATPTLTQHKTEAALAQHQTEASPAVDALRSGEFRAAEQSASAAIERDPTNPYALLVRAITRYRESMHQLSTDVRTVVIGAVAAGGFNHRYMRSSLEQTEEALAAVEADLSLVSSHPDVSLDLCLACWEVDWNHNGRVDRRDRLLFQIEQDARGEPIPEDDPRRKPTFRFDHGDVAWARAFVSFQRAAVALVLAYDWDSVDEILATRGDRMPKRLVIRLGDKGLVTKARRHIVQGLAFSEEARRAYLAETDDEREWVPNPKQRSHPLPLPVDDALYETWGAVVGDLTRLVSGEEGLSVEEIAQLGDHVWEDPPRGYVDVGKMLAEPKDIVLNLRELERLERDDDIEGVLGSVLGDYYVRSMKASPLPARLGRMKNELERGEESFERKLRYLIWIN